MVPTNELEFELKKAIGGEVRFDAYSRVLYSTDASIYRIEPLGVVIPRDRDDVMAAMEIARRHRVPIIARGALRQAQDCAAPAGGARCLIVRQPATGAGKKIA